MNQILAKLPAAQAKMPASMSPAALLAVAGNTTGSGTFAGTINTWGEA